MSSIFTRECLSRFDCKAHKLSCNNIVACFMTSYHRLPNWQVLLQIWLPFFFFPLVTMVTKNSCNLECCSDQICLLKQLPALAYHCVLFINFFYIFLKCFFLVSGWRGDFYNIFRWISSARQWRLLYGIWRKKTAACNNSAANKYIHSSCHCTRYIMNYFSRHIIVT